MLDIQSILSKAFTELYITHIGLITIGFVVSIIMFTFRYEIGYEFHLTYRQRRKLTEKVLLFLVGLSVATVAFLVLEGYIFVLLGLFYFILTYFLYEIGFFDSIVEKMR